MITLESLKKKEKYITIFLCIIISFLFLMICSGNSFLYAFNDWVDLNWFMTMGRGVLNGKVPYKDLFEQKGPILYFVFAIFELFKNPYMAVFIFEIICFSIYLYYSFKIARNYLSYYMSIALIMVLGYCTLTWLPFISGGGAVEEYSLPVIAYFIYIQKQNIDGVEFSKIRSCVLGVLVSILFWTKFTTIIIPAVILVIWLVQNLLRKNFKDTFISIGFMAIGFLIVTIPIFIWYFAKGAIVDLFYVYFYCNLFLYSKQPSTMDNLLSAISGNVFLIIAFIMACIVLILLLILFFKKSRNWFLLFLPAIIQLIVFLNIQNVYLYYFLIIMPYFTFLIYFVLKAFDKISIKTIEKFAVCVVFFATTFGLMFSCSNNICELGRTKDDYIQFEVAEDIKELAGTNNYTLFCYAMKDYGFYNVCGVVPKEKFYAKFNFPVESFPEMYEAFDNAIINKNNDFVIMLKQDYTDKQEFVCKYYSYVKEYSYIFYDHNLDFMNLEIVLLKVK